AAARHHDGHAGDGSLVDVALESVRHALQPELREPKRFRFCLGERRGLRGGGVIGGGQRGHGFSRLLSYCSQGGQVSKSGGEDPGWTGAPAASRLQSSRRLCLKQRGTAATEFPTGV